MSVPSRLSKEDIDEVLAYIDCCVAKGSRPKKFENSLLSHLSYSRQKHVTFKQVDEKLKYLWDYDANRSFTEATQATDHTYIYRVGTRALNLPTERLRNIRARAYQVKHRPIHHTIVRGRRGHGHKVHHSSPLRSHTRLSRTATDTPSELRSATVSEVEIRQSVIVELPANANGSLENCAFAEYPRNSSILDSSRFESPESPSLSLSGIVSQTRASVQKTSPSKKLWKLSHSPRKSENYESLKNELADRESAIQDYRHRLFKAQQRIAEQDREMSCAREVDAIGKKDGGEPSTATLARYVKEISILKSKNTDRELLSTFTTRVATKHIPTDVGYLKRNMATIRGVIGDFMTCAETLQECNEINSNDISHELRPLFQRVVGKPETKLKSLSLHCLLQSLLSAAVCEWVWECNLQEYLFTSCPLRDAMLSHLVALDGVDVARNLDVAAHRTLINDDYFQEDLIPRRITQFLNHTSTIVQLLFNLHKPLERWDMNFFDEWKRSIPALKTMFRAALNIKIAAVLSKDTFRIVFPWQGSDYNPEHMEMESSDGDDADLRKERRRLVLLCLVPGLQLIPSDPKLVDYNGFQNFEHGSELSGSLTVVEPLVTTS